MRPTAQWVHPTWRRCVWRALCPLLSILPVGLIAQVTYIHQDISSNLDCQNAIQVCDSTHYTCTDSLAEVCHWFFFVLDTEQFVHIQCPIGKTLMLDDIDAYENCVSDCSPWDSQGPFEYSGMMGPGTFYLVTRFVGEAFDIHILVGDLYCPPMPCEGCLPTFSPLPGKKYIVSAWAKEEGNELGRLFYDKPRLRVQVPPGITRLELIPSQSDAVMVEGWQLLEGSFTMPALGGEIIVSLASSDNSPVLFDDVRIFPADGSMKSYVYDPHDLRFVAELDERHFATFYEYDNEGRLVRVKKETERGIRTLKETRQSAPRVAP